MLGSTQRASDNLALIAGLSKQVAWVAEIRRVVDLL